MLHHGVKLGKHCNITFYQVKNNAFENASQLWNTQIKLFLKTYGKDEIDKMVPSHNYDTVKNL